MDKMWEESKKLWYIGRPAILPMFQLSLELVIVTFVEYLGEVELAAIFIPQNVVQGFVVNILVMIIYSYISCFLPLVAPKKCSILLNKLTINI